MNKSIKISMLVSMLIVAFGLSASDCFASSKAMAKVIGIDGQAKYQKAGSENWVDLTKDTQLSEGDILETAESSTVRLMLTGSDKTGEIEVRPASRFVFDTFNYDAQNGLDNTLLDVEVGSILVKAEKLKGDSKFEVKTPTSIVGIRGTTFEVNVSK